MRRRLVQNPPWATRVLTASWQTMTEHVKPAWLPIIDQVEYASRGSVSGEIHEYGCGQYGCVFPTYDNDVVLKVTADSTEAEFAAALAPSIEAPICVTYHAVIRLGEKFKDATERTTLYLLWRESATHVGDADALGGPATDLINAQHEAAQRAYKAIIGHEDDWLIHQHVQNWLAACAQMTADPGIASLGQGMVDTYQHHHIFFGDVHAGNVGIVTRGSSDMWVITDPGHVAVIDSDPEEHIQTIRRSQRESGPTTRRRST